MPEVEKKARAKPRNLLSKIRAMGEHHESAYRNLQSDDFDADLRDELARDETLQDAVARETRAKEALDAAVLAREAAEAAARMPRPRLTALHNLAQSIEDAKKS